MVPGAGEEEEAASVPTPYLLTHPWLMLPKSSLSPGVPVGSPLLHPLGQMRYPPAPAPGASQPWGSCAGCPKNCPDVWEEEGDGQQSLQPDEGKGKGEENAGKR